MKDSLFELDRKDTDHALESWSGPTERELFSGYPLYTHLGKHFVLG